MYLHNIAKCWIVLYSCHIGSHVCCGGFVDFGRVGQESFHSSCLSEKALVLCEFPHVCLVETFCALTEGTYKEGKVALALADNGMGL